MVYFPEASFDLFREHPSVHAVAARTSWCCSIGAELGALLVVICCLLISGRELDTKIRGNEGPLGDRIDLEVVEIVFASESGGDPQDEAENL